MGFEFLMSAEYPKVLVVGPSDRPGGIATVIRSHRAMSLWGLAHCRMLATYDERDSFMKVAIMLKAYVLAVFEIHHASLIHVHVAAQNSMWRKLPIVLLTKLMRKPYIVHLHAASERSVFGLTPQWLVRLIFLLSYRVAVLSDSWATVVKKHLPEARVTVIHNPVRKPQAARTPEPAGMVLFAGKLERRKGYMELLEAAVGVLEFFPNVTFCFAGHGEIEQAKAKAKLLNIEKSVSFLGWIGPEEMGDYYRRATVFCLPSFDEGLPMAVIEAMSHSLPVVTTPVGGLPDLISDGTDGLFARPGDVHAIVDQLLGLLRNPERADRIGRNAALTIERTCNSVLIEEQLLNLYHEVNAEWMVRRCGIPEATPLNMQARR